MAASELLSVNGTKEIPQTLIPAALEEPIPPSLLHRSLKDLPYKVVSAKGVNLTLSDGRIVMDGCAGAAVACIGHGNDEVAAAVAKQMSIGVSYLHSLTYTTDAAEELAHLIISGPEGAGRFGLTKLFLVSSGSEAMDAALKFARQYWYEKGEMQRTKIVSRYQSYHGNTIGAMNVSSNLPRKIPYAAYQGMDVSWVTPAYQYQYSNWQDGETEEEFATRLVTELDEHFVKLGPENVIGFIAEPLVGATSACTPAPKGYFKGVREVCDKYGILLILDEIMCGMGRTGTMFAFEQEGIVPDLVTIAKGMGGGYTPIAGVVVNEKIIDILRKGTSVFNHGQTYQAHPLACASTLAVQKIVRREKLVENVQRLGKWLQPLLIEQLGSCKYVGDIRGRGLFWGIEFISDKVTREPFPLATGFGLRYQAICFELGVAVYPGQGTKDGKSGDHAILSPPYNVTDEELRKMVQIMRKAYDRLEAEIDREACGAAHTNGVVKS
jgi:adenosylmethionine-8-amino-7-oxononanoate aminotransferase